MQPRHSVAILVALVSPAALVAVAHCGGATRTFAGAGDGSTDATAQGEGSAGGGDAACGPFGCDEPQPVGPFAPCSPTPPEAGTPCAVPGEQCEYGGGFLLQCNPVLSCYGGVWTSPVGNGCALDPFADAGDAGCPATWSESNGFVGSGTCPALDCEYPEGYCACQNYCSGAGQAPTPRQRPRRTVSGAWACKASVPPCTTPRPLLGTPCDTDAACDYGWPCGCGERQSCVQGVWQGAPIPVCP
jgi:hypothetical protein